ncbi:MAG: glycosyltransferase [Eggerthellaceae bacterium]|nr:glycosyltransferase [Eggerthellaceae bacterium]
MTEKPPAVSIVVPLHNSSAHIGPIVDAIKAQTEGDFEAILVDDGSTDETFELAQAATEGDSRFVLLAQENAGPGMARNAGLAVARGEWVLFFDVDDYPHEDLLEKALSRAQETGADIVVYGHDHQWASGGPSWPSHNRWDASKLPEVFSPHDIADDLFGVLRNWPWDKMWRRQFLQDAGISFPPLYRTEDMPFTCLGLVDAKKISLLDDVLYTYRVGALVSSTQTLDSAPFDFFEACCLLKAGLEQRGLFESYRRSYLQWVGTCVAVNLLGLRSPLVFEEVYGFMHEKGLGALGLNDGIGINGGDQGAYDLDEVRAKGGLQADGTLVGNSVLPPVEVSEYLEFGTKLRLGAAGSATDADVAVMVDIVRLFGPAQGAFLLMRCGQELRERDYAQELHRRDDIIRQYEDRIDVLSNEGLRDYLKRKKNSPST